MKKHSLDTALRFTNLRAITDSPGAIYAGIVFDFDAKKSSDVISATVKTGKTYHDSPKREHTPHSRETDSNLSQKL